MVGTVLASWALFVGLALLMVGNGLQGTLLGVRATVEGFPTAVTGLLMSGYFAGFLVGSVIAPRLVGRVGHVRVFAALASLASTAILAQAVFVEPATWTLLRLISGFCYAGLYVVTESWLNAQATNETRGRLLSVYMMITLGGMASGQFLLNLADPGGAELFILVSILVSLALIPMLLSAGSAPLVEAPASVGLRALYRTSPTGVVGLFGTGLAQGAMFGMGAVYGRAIGLTLGEISLFMGLVLIGGMVLQWPVGRASDAFDRRRVLTLVALLGATLALATGWVVGQSRLGLFVLVALLGGMMMPMYSLCIAYTNDYLRPDQMVGASGTLVLVGGMGASLGPVTVASMMSLAGPEAFMGYMVVVHAAIGLFALYRMTRRTALPLAEQGSYPAMSPRTTQVAGAMYAEVALEETEHGGAIEPEAAKADARIAP